MTRPPNRPDVLPNRQACVGADICYSCSADLRDEDRVGGCRPKTVAGLLGLPYTWPEDSDEPAPPDQRCHHCLVPLGAFHHWACSVELCPACGGQLLYCGCLP